MYKTWFQRQKANSPYRASAELIAGAGGIGSGVPIADSAAELKPNSQKSNNYNPAGKDETEGVDTDTAALKALKDSLENETDVAKKLIIQEQINALEVSIAAKEQKK